VKLVTLTGQSLRCSNLSVLLEGALAFLKAKTALNTVQGSGQSSEDIHTNEGIPTKPATHARPLFLKKSKIDGTTTPILGIDVSKPPALSLEPIKASAGTEYVRSEFRPKPWMTNQSLDRWLIVFAGLFILRAELGKADEAFPPVDELVKRVLVQEEADRQHQVGLEYSFNLTTEHYDANGQRTSAQTVRASAKAKANIEYTTDLAPGARGTAKNDQEASQVDRAT
jgi:hypothetical protein